MSLTESVGINMTNLTGPLSALSARRDTAYPGHTGNTGFRARRSAISSPELAAGSIALGFYALKGKKSL